MAFSYESEFIFIGRGDESFLENYSYELSEDAGGKGGRLFMSLEILNNQAEAEDIGEAIFSNLKQKFYENLDADPYERFENALKAANTTIETMKEEKVSRFIGNLNIALAAVVGESLYISVAGDADVYLVRKRFVSILSDGLAEDSHKETFVNIANGTLEPFDRIVLSSTRLLRYITKGELGRIMSDPEASKIGVQLSELQDFIMTEILGRSAVIGVAVSIEPEQEEAFQAEDFEKRPGFFNFTFWSGLTMRMKSLVQRFSSLPGLSALKERLAALLPEKLKPAPKPSIFQKIQWPQHMTKEKILFTAIFLLVVLVGGTLWIRSRTNENRAIAEQKVKLNQVQDLLNDAATTGQFDKAKAAESMTEAERLTLEVLQSRYLRGEAVKILDDIQKQRDALDNVVRVKAPMLAADFSEKRPTVSTLGMLALKDRLFGFEYNALYEVVLDALQEPLTVSDVETVILGASFPEKNALLFLTRTGKMIEYADANFGLVTTKDGIWKKGVEMESYNDRVYILDPERNQIWRYIRRRDGFDIGEAYNQNADLKNAVSLAIDSSVYVLNADGTITQMYQGQKQDFPIRKAPLQAVTAPTKIFTTAELGYIYILEPSTQRVIVYRKDPKNGGAQYHTQYVFDKVGALRDLLVLDSRLYVADEKRAYVVNLSGL